MKTLPVAVLAVLVLGLVLTPIALATSTEHFLGYDLIYHDDGHIERVDGAQNYVRYDGIIEPISLMEQGTIHYPYLIEDTGTNWKYTIEDRSIFIPKTFDVTETSNKISPALTYSKTQLINNMVSHNATVSYLVFPYSLSTTKDWADANNIRLGRWNFDTSITIFDNNETVNYLSPDDYDFRVVNDEIRLYFVKSAANALSGDITFQMNSWTVLGSSADWSGVDFNSAVSTEKSGLIVLDGSINTSIEYAFGKTSFATTEYSATYASSKAVDDSSGTSWLAEDDPAVPQSWTVDLNNTYLISNISSFQSHLGNYRTSVCEVLYSTDNITYSELIANGSITPVTSGPLVQEDILEYMRYLRINVTPQNFGVGISEVDIYGFDHNSSGNVTTDIVDSGSGYKLYQVSTNGTYVGGQTADIYVNTSADNSTWSDWQLVQTSAVSGTEYEVPSAYQKRYYQTKIVLETTDVSETPVLENIRSNTAVDAPAGDGIIYVSANGDGDYNCDGTDDQVQINQAFAEVEGNASLTTVYLKDDGGAIDYIISDQIEMCDDSHFTGALGVKVQLEGGLTENDFEQMVTGNTLISGKVYNRLTDAEISNIFFDGNRDNWGGDPDDDDARETISIRGSGISIHDCTFDNGVGDAIRIANYGEFEPDVEIYDNEFWKSGHCNIYILYTGSTGDNRVWIHDNNLNEVYSNAGIRFDDVSGSLIENNTITADPGHPWSDMPIYISYVGDSGSGTYCHDNEIRYNKIYGSYREHGILLVSRYNGAVIKSETTGNHIHHNLIYKGLGYDGNAGGINVYGIDGALVEYNTIYGGQGDGITSEEYLSYSMTTTGFVVTVENNIIQGMTYYSGTFAGYGISNHEASQVTINSDYNNIYDCAGGAYSGVTPGDNDTSVDALFYDTANDIYTLKSTFGVWDGDSWETTETQSPCIDGADPADSYSNEPEDNGDLPNLGRWGNTIYASKSGVGEGWENISDIFWYVGFRETVGTSGNRLRFGSPTVNDTEVANFDVVVS